MQANSRCDFAISIKQSNFWVKIYILHYPKYLTELLIIYNAIGICFLTFETFVFFLVNQSIAANKGGHRKHNPERTDETS